MQISNSHSLGQGFVVSPVGTIHTPFDRPTGTPIQSGSGAGAEGYIDLNRGLEDAVRDLAGFERLWLIYLFHKTSEPQLLARPYLDVVDHGIFATRSPARPNRIGMSPVRLLGVDGLRIRIADVDMLDGTPLLDIKPYVPMFDHFEVTRIGWFEGKSPVGVVADNRFEGEKK